MKSRLTHLCVAASLALTFSVYASDYTITGDTTVLESPVPYFTVNGQAVEDLNLTVINGSTYASLSVVAQAIRSDVSVAWENNQACVTADNLNITAKPGDVYIQANGRYLWVPSGVILENNRVMVPIRTIAQAMSAGLIWNPETGIVELYRGAGSILPAEQFYNSTDLYWLTQIINAESGNQPLDGKLAVGAVVMNRTYDPSYPNTIKDVIFQKNQFTPARNGTIYKTANVQSEIAAKLCLEGTVVNEDIFYFINPVTSPNSWASKNRPYVMTIANHAFYA